LNPLLDAEAKNLFKLRGAHMCEFTTPTCRMQSRPDKHPCARRQRPLLTAGRGRPPVTRRRVSRSPRRNLRTGAKHSEETRKSRASESNVDIGCPSKSSRGRVKCALGRRGSYWRRWGAGAPLSKPATLKSSSTSGQ
jgi:hypothetical protein